MSAWTCRWCNGKADPKIVPPRPRIPSWKGLGADSEEKREPVSDIDTAVVDSLKVLDLKWPIREADIAIECPATLPTGGIGQATHPCAGPLPGTRLIFSSIKTQRNFHVTIDHGTPFPSFPKNWEPQKPRCYFGDTLLRHANGTPYGRDQRRRRATRAAHRSHRKSQQCGRYGNQFSLSSVQSMLA